MKEEIKELTSLEDFKIVYGVFSGPPYNEKIYRRRTRGNF